MNETTTMYGVRWNDDLAGYDDKVEERADRADAERLIREYPDWCGVLMEGVVTTVWTEVRTS